MAFGNKALKVVAEKDAVLAQESLQLFVIILQLT